MRLEDRERLERLELDEMAKTRGGSALFEGKDAEVFSRPAIAGTVRTLFCPGLHCPAAAD